MTSKEEYREVSDRGYRKVIGTMLWPARNCYPVISYALSQLSRSLEKQHGSLQCTHCII